MQFCIIMTTGKESRVQRLLTYCNGRVRKSKNKLKTDIFSEHDVSVGVVKSYYVHNGDVTTLVNSPLII